jgi:hypothetical protein
MKKIVLLLSFFFGVCAKAESAETAQFRIAGFAQACAREDVNRPYLCASPDGVSAVVPVVLVPVPPDPKSFEESAYEGSSEETGLSLQGDGQYNVKVTVRKSVSMQGRSVIYVFTLQAYRFVGDDKATVYLTKKQVYDRFNIGQAMLMMADRETTSERFFRQIYFTLNQL